jgi:hypothetical protein
LERFAEGIVIGFAAFQTVYDELSIGINCLNCARVGALSDMLHHRTGRVRASPPMVISGDAPNRETEDQSAFPMPSF